MTHMDLKGKQDSWGWWWWWWVPCAAKVIGKILKSILNLIGGQSRFAITGDLSVQCLLKSQLQQFEQVGDVKLISD